MQQNAAESAGASRGSNPCPVCPRGTRAVLCWRRERERAAPRAAQEYIGFSSTLDPLFRADKLLIRAQPLVPDSKQDAYSDTVDKWIEKVGGAGAPRRGAGAAGPA